MQNLTTMIENGPQFGVRTPMQLAARVQEVGSTEYLIEGLLPIQSLSLVIGDSGLGKSPLMYQAAVAVAAGVPYLGRHTRQGRVLYLDCENGLVDVADTVGRVAGCLGLERPPEDLLLWNFNDSDGVPDLEKLLAYYRPSWIIIDPLKAIYTRIEEKTQLVTDAYQQLRLLMKSRSCAVSGIHHLRKPSDGREVARPSLGGPDYRAWFNEARGARELVNGCDVRLGVDLIGPSSGSNLLFRGFSRVRGDTTPLNLTRVCDDEGEPLGFRLICGVEALDNPEQRAAYARLPDSFRFKDAEACYGKGPQATADFLRKCESIRLVEKLGGKQGYRRISSPPATVATTGVGGAFCPLVDMSLSVN